jgi:hypothetical protein
MMLSIMSETDTLPSNWGRWGDDDELGTLNLITDEVRARAAREARLGRSVSLAMPIQPTPVFSGPFAPQVAEPSPVQHIMVYTGSPAFANADVMTVTNHHTLSTHLDALAHIVRDGRVYPGRPVNEAVTMAGVQHGSTTAFAAGIVTRGVLLDLASDGPVPRTVRSRRRISTPRSSAKASGSNPATRSSRGSGGWRRGIAATRCRA